MVRERVKVKAVAELQHLTCPPTTIALGRVFILEHNMNVLKLESVDCLLFMKVLE
jgi:hypothetical protein